MQKKLILPVLLLCPTLIAGLSGCVTEEPGRAVVIEGRRIFAPRGFQGRWVREDRPEQELRFQLPPQPALLVVRGRAAGPGDDSEAAAMTDYQATEAYDIQRTIERPDGSVSFRLVPVGGTGRPQERHFRLAGGSVASDPTAPRVDRMFEIFPDEGRPEDEQREIMYQRR